MRIVSVLPSATEIVCALGGRNALVGRSQECDYPASVRELPIVMRATSLDADRTSREIDDRVQAALRRGESLYTLDVDLLTRLAPDLLLTQDLCRVCSVTDDEVAIACRNAGVAPRILSVSPIRIDEVWSSIEAIGDAMGATDAGRALAGGLRARTAPPSSPRESARVAVLEWLDPPIESGLWTPELIASAGGSSWSARAGGPAPRLSWDALFSDRPDMAVLSPCSFTAERTMAELAGSPLGSRLSQWMLPGGVWVADESFFSRPGPRLADGRDLVRALLRGEVPQASSLVRAWSAPSRKVAA